MQQLFLMDRNVDILLITSRSQFVRYNILEKHGDSLFTLLHHKQFVKSAIPQMTPFDLLDEVGIDVCYFLEFYGSYLIALDPFDLLYWTALFKVYSFYEFLNQHVTQWNSLAL